MSAPVGTVIAVRRARVIGSSASVSATRRCSRPGSLITNRGTNRAIARMDTENATASSSPGAMPAMNIWPTDCSATIE